MSFWGMSDEGKQARGNLNQYGAWNWDQYKNWSGRGNEAYDQAGPLRQTFIDHQTNRMNNGFYSPDQLTEFGKQAMPGVDEAIGRQWGRLNDIGQEFNNVVIPQTDFAIDTMQRNNATLGQNIRDTGDIEQGNINKAYDTVDSNVAMLKPGGQMQTAQVARSYAPMVANTAARIRSAGIDPNSPQAASLMRGAETARARGMDDAAASGMGKYVGASNDAALGRMGANNTLQDTSFNRTSDWLDQNTGNALTARGLRKDDWNTRANLGREQNTQEDHDIGLRDARYQRGLQWGGMDTAERNAGADALGQQSNADFARSFRAADTGRGFGQDAYQGWSDVYKREAQNAGWGSKMLLGAGLDLLTGGVSRWMGNKNGRQQGAR